VVERVVDELGRVGVPVGAGEIPLGVTQEFLDLDEVTDGELSGFDGGGMGGVEFTACQLAFQDDLKRGLLVFDRDVEAADEGINSVRAGFEVRVAGVGVFGFAQQPE
jgi:hypothetical protein